MSDLEIAATEGSADVPPLDLFGMIQMAWARRWLVLLVTIVFTAGGVTYALLATKWYRATVTLAPVDRSALPNGLGGLSSLAGLVGISLPSSGTAESIATLKSHSFLGEFITDLNLMPVLFADKWDPATNKWRSADDEEAPDLRDATKLLSTKIVAVSEDKRSGMIRVSVDWKDARTASDWANVLVSRVNARLRARAEAEAQANIDHLSAELSQNRIVGVQQSISRVLESEIQKLMLAKGSQEFAFRVIDPATPPKLKSRPQRTLIAMISCVVGGAAGVLLSIILGTLRQRRAMKPVG